MFNLFCSQVVCTDKLIHHPNMGIGLCARWSGLSRHVSFRVIGFNLDPHSVALNL